MSRYLTRDRMNIPDSRGGGGGGGGLDPWLHFLNVNRNFFPLSLSLIPLLGLENRTGRNYPILNQQQNFPMPIGSMCPGPRSQEQINPERCNYASRSRAVGSRDMDSRPRGIDEEFNPRLDQFNRPTTTYPEYDSDCEYYDPATEVSRPQTPLVNCGPIQPPKTSWTPFDGPDFYGDLIKNLEGRFSELTFPIPLTGIRVYNNGPRMPIPMFETTIVNALKERSRNQSYLTPCQMDTFPGGKKFSSSNLGYFKPPERSTVPDFFQDFGGEYSDKLEQSTLNESRAQCQEDDFGFSLSHLRAQGYTNPEEPSSSSTSGRTVITSTMDKEFEHEPLDDPPDNDTNQNSVQNSGKKMFPPLPSRSSARFMNKPEAPLCGITPQNKEKMEARMRNWSSLRQRARAASTSATVLYTPRNQHNRRTVQRHVPGSGRDRDRDRDRHRNINSISPKKGTSPGSTKTLDKPSETKTVPGKPVQSPSDNKNSTEPGKKTNTNRPDSTKTDDNDQEGSSSDEWTTVEHRKARQVAGNGSSSARKVVSPVSGSEGSSVPAQTSEQKIRYMMMTSGYDRRRCVKALEYADKDVNVALEILRSRKLMRPTRLK